MSKIKNVRIVSLSSGIIGEKFVKHEFDIGVKRLFDMGLNVSFSENALMGEKFLKEHPDKRAEDLISAFRDDSVDMVLCAIGGDDTYRLIPYLFEDSKIENALSNKIFLGFSDTTINHFTLGKLGLKTYYGQSFLADICELDKTMLPYTEKYFKELINTGKIDKIEPSEVWYEERLLFDKSQVGVPRISHKDRGFELLQGPPVFSGKIFGGCIDSIYDMFYPERYSDMPEICSSYGIFPPSEWWDGKILLLESSEEMPKPEVYEKALAKMKDRGVFDKLSGIIVGKPMNEHYYEEYKTIIKYVINDPGLPILYNVNTGHAAPRCIIPFLVNSYVDSSEEVIRFEYGK